MTPFPLLVLLAGACTSTPHRPPASDTDADSDTDIDSDTDTDTDTDTGTHPGFCAAASWSWNATNTVAQADASFIGHDADAEAFDAVLPGDLDGDGIDDLVILALEEGDGGAMYILTGGVRRTLDQPLDGRPSFLASAALPLGGEVMGAGDINGDGLADIVQGPDYVYAGNQAHVVLGRAGGWPVGAGWDQADATITNTNNTVRSSPDLDPSKLFGPYGDADGDGIDDLMLMNQALNNGEVHVISGAGVTGAIDAPAADLSYVRGGDDRVTLSGYGDYDGDGLTDLALHTSDWDVLYVLTAADLAGAQGDEVPDRASTTITFPLFSLVKALPDLDGDGDAEIAVMASSDPLPDEEHGLYLFLGGPGWRPTEGLEDASTRIMGSVLDNAGWVADVNGDGLPELLVNRDVPERGDAQVVYMYFGRASWPAELSLDDADVVFEPDETDWYRMVFPSAQQQGDINGDGYGDLVFAEENEPVDGMGEAGHVYVFLGGPTWPSSLTRADADVTFVGSVPNQRIGMYTVLDDVDGDGCDDLVTGSFLNPPQGDRGEVYVLFGQPS